MCNIKAIKLLFTAEKKYCSVDSARQPKQYFIQIHDYKQHPNIQLVTISSQFNLQPYCQQLRYQSNVQRDLKDFNFHYQQPSKRIQIKLQEKLINLSITDDIILDIPKTYFYRGSGSWTAKSETINCTYLCSYYFFLIFIKHMFLSEFSLEQHSKNYTALTSQQFGNRFKVEGELGSGTFGSVYKLTSTEGQVYAIKQFNRDAMKNVKQIIREVDNLKRLEHPNIVRFYECYVVDKKKFRILLQYCQGGNLENYIKNPTISEVNRLSLILDIAEGLAYAHQQKIVHRDLKPENIFVGKGGRAKIGDFGCSIQMEDELEPMMSRVGSPAYMDQRISDGSPYDISVDIYAFGLIIFCIYKGKGLYDQCSTTYKIKKMQSSIYKDYDQKMEELTEDLPPLIKNIIKNCLQTDFNQRYNAREICSLIENQLVLKKQKDIANRSTEEEVDIQDQNSILSMEIMKLMKDLERKQKMSSTKRGLLELLHNFKEKMEFTLEIQHLKYVDPRTKQKFIAFIYFYYVFWLKRMEQFVTCTNSLFKAKYNHIDPEELEPSLRQTLIQKIQSERKKYWPFLLKCCRQINTKLRLSNQPVSNNFKEIIKMVCADNIKFDEFHDEAMKNEVWLFFNKEVKKQYHQNCGLDHSDDQKLKKVEDLCKNL